jgi:hypothetical protein
MIALYLLHEATTYETNCEEFQKAHSCIQINLHKWHEHLKNCQKHRFKEIHSRNKNLFVAHQVSTRRSLNFFSFHSTKMWTFLAIDWIWREFHQQQGPSSNKCEYPSAIELQIAFQTERRRKNIAGKLNGN